MILPLRHPPRLSVRSPEAPTISNIPGNAPVPVDLQQVLAQIDALQGQLTTLQAENATLTTQIQGLQQAAVAPQGQAVAPPAGGSQAQAIAPVASFALTPATTDVAGLINYSSKLGQLIYKQGCKNSPTMRDSQ
jgi:hypothetical protein